jgi:hypothetical protein
MATGADTRSPEEDGASVEDLKGCQRQPSQPPPILRFRRKGKGGKGREGRKNRVKIRSVMVKKSRESIHFIRKEYFHDFFFMIFLFFSLERNISKI